MTKEEYAKNLLSYLAVIQNVHDFSQASLGVKTQRYLASFRNQAQNLGLNTIYSYLDKVLRSDDKDAQRMLLFSGISADSGFSDKDMKSLVAIISDSYRKIGGDPDAIMDSIALKIKEKKEEEEVKEEDTEEDLGIDSDSSDEPMDDLGLDDELGADDENTETDEEDAMSAIDALDSLAGDSEEDTTDDESDSEEEISPDDLDQDTNDALSDLGIDLDDEDSNQEDVTVSGEDDRVAKESGDDKGSEPAEEKEKLTPLYDSKNRIIDNLIDEIIWNGQ
jgi:hypothetical protein